MNKMLRTLVYISSIGFLTGWIGTFTGMLLSYVAVNLRNKLKGVLLSFIGGLMLAVVCFDLLPESLESGSVYMSISGIFVGLIVAVIIDRKLEHTPIRIQGDKSRRYSKVAIFMTIGIGIHNIPAGLAIGSLLFESFSQGIHLAVALVLHGIPEGLAIGIFLKESGGKLYKFILFSIFTSIPMSVGALAGGVVSNSSPYFASLGLALAGGLILYIIFEETLPESRELWDGWLSTVGNVFGIIIGILIISFFK